MIIDKKPLNFNKYNQYEIDQRYCAYIIQVDNISECDAEQLEWEYFNSGYKIFHSELIRIQGDLFAYQLIIAKLEYTF